MNRIVDLYEGTAFVVTDLHGEWEPYQLYRDYFLHLYERGEAHYLIFLGDVIHGYGSEEDDASIDMLLDIIRLKQELGNDHVLMLLGNHELPHIYGITLSKGNINFTPRFEHALGANRPQIIDFLKALPFAVRTSNGVMLTHAGASALTSRPDAMDALGQFSHDKLLNEAESLMRSGDVIELMERVLKIDQTTYDQAARLSLAVEGTDDPRYHDLLRGVVASNLEPEWSILWNFFFTRCEQDMLLEDYAGYLQNFLDTYSAEVPLRALVTGHISVRGGAAVIADKQLRLASWAHALPPEDGSFLYLDMSVPINDAHDLLSFVYPIIE